MSDRIKVEGAVFANTYKKAKNHPDFTGKIELSKTLLKELVERAKANQDISVSVAMWDRTSKDGKIYKYLYDVSTNGIAPVMYVSLDPSADLGAVDIDVAVFPNVRRPD